MQKIIYFHALLFAGFWYGPLTLPVPCKFAFEISIKSYDIDQFRTSLWSSMHHSLKVVRLILHLWGLEGYDDLASINKLMIWFIKMHWHVMYKFRMQFLYIQALMCWLKSCRFRDTQTSLNRMFLFSIYFHLCQYIDSLSFSGSGGNSPIWGRCFGGFAKSLALPLYHTLRLGEGLVTNK